MRDLIASHAPLRTRTHKARPASSKTLPRGSNGGRSPLGLSFSHIFLQTKKDMAVGDRWKSRATGKNVKSETPRRSDLMLQRGAFCFVVQYETKGRKRVYIKVKENLSD